MKTTTLKKTKIAHAIRQKYDESFDKLPPTVRDTMNAMPCYLGSENWINAVVHEIIKVIQPKKRSTKRKAKHDSI